MSVFPPGRRTLAGPVLAIAALALLACSGADEQSNRLSVVATTTQIGEFVREVGGDAIEITVILKPGQEAHDHEAEPSQLRAIASADLVFQNGLGLDSFVGKALEQGSSAPVTVTRGVETRTADERPDPHVWHSVANAVRMVENIRDALIEADPANAATFEANAAEYVAELEALDAEIRSSVSNLPPACRRLITNHDVFAYYARDYGFELLASLLPATSSAAAASASDVAALVELMRRERISVVFADIAGNSALLDRAADEAGVRLVNDLYGDSLGPEGSEGETYTGMMRWNTQRIVEALANCEGEAG